MSSTADIPPTRTPMAATFARLWAPATAIVAALVIAGPLPNPVPDSEYYRTMAEGGPVVAPFSGRIAYPEAAHLVGLLGVNAELSFAMTGLLSLMLFSVGVALLLKDTPGIAVALTLATPVLVKSFDASYLPDLAFAAAIATLFVVIRSYETADWTPLLLLVPFLIRESAALFGVVLVVVACRRRRLRLALVALVTTILGYVLTGWAASAGGQTTMHGVGGPLYLVTKAPYNLMKNVLGLEVATNDLNRCGAELHRIPYALGNIVAAGLCPFNPLSPLSTAAVWLTTFGVAPAMLMVVLLRRPRVVRPAIWEQVLLWSGVLSFGLAPALGASVDRMAAYGWPAFTVAVPLLLSRLLLRADLVRAVAASFVLSWGAYLVDLTVPERAGVSVTIALGLLCQVLAYRWAARRLALPPDASM